MADEPLESRLAPLVTRRSSRLEGPNGERWRLRVEKDAPEWLTRPLPAGSLVFANNGVGDYLFLAPAVTAVQVYWYEGGRIEEYCASLDDLLPNLPRPPSDHGPITYRGTEAVVRLGDRVHVRYWLFFKGEGTVKYVPGVSPIKRTLERDGLAWVRVSLDKGALIDCVVMPDGALQRSVTLLARKTT